LLQHLNGAIEAKLGKISLNGNSFFWLFSFRQSFHLQELLPVGAQVSAGNNLFWDDKTSSAGVQTFIAVARFGYFEGEKSCESLEQKVLALA
jgi:hypothetical protein